MIASLRGTVIANNGQVVVLDVGGVGYQVLVTAESARNLRIGDSHFLHTSFILREDSMTLYGFESAAVLNLFDLLLTVSGVGPKSALGIVSAMSPAEIATAVAQEKDSAFKSVTGIGPKTAKLIVVSLTGKLDHVAGVQPARSDHGAQIDEKRVITALQGLGWNERQANDAVAAVLDEVSETATTDSVLRLALAKLGSGKSMTK